MLRDTEKERMQWAREKLITKWALIRMLCWVLLIFAAGYWAGSC